MRLINGDMDAETKEKIKSIKALQGLTVEGLCNTPEFIQNLGKYIAAQVEERRLAAKAVSRGMRLPSHVVDRVIKSGLMESPERFRDEFLEVLCGTSRRSSAEREYIAQLGDQAYRLTVANFAVAEYPELRPVFFPEKAN